MISRLFKRPPPAVAPIPAPAPLPPPPYREDINQFQERVGDGPVPTYPDAGPALVAASPAELMATQTAVIARIKDNCALAPAEFDRLILPVFSRYAEWAHLLPASEMHHHCGVGGLFRHGLEVAMHAARIAEGKYLGLDLDPSQRQAYFERWRIGTLLAGLLHDIGKPLVEVAAVDLSGTRTWSPHVQSLYAWLHQHQMTHYVFYWRDGPRRDHHLAMGPSVAREIIGSELLVWLSEFDCGDVYNLMIETLARMPDSTNTMAYVIQSAVDMSCELDLIQQAKRTTSLSR